MIFMYVPVENKIHGLYAKTFNNVSSTQIGITLFFGYVGVAFSNLIIPSLADNYGFDRMFILVLQCKFNLIMTSLRI